MPLSERLKASQRQAQALKSVRQEAMREKASKLTLNQIPLKIKPLYKEAIQIIRSNLQYIKNKTFKRYKHLYQKCIKSGKHKLFTSKKYSELNINYFKRIKINIKNIDKKYIKSILIKLRLIIPPK